MSAQPIRGWAASAFLAGALALSGCGSGDDLPSSAAATRTPTPAKTAAAASASASAPAAMRGSWERTMRARDWKAVGQGYPLGTWRFVVKRNRDVEVYLPRTSTVDFTTQFTTAGDQLTIESVPICPGETGKYTWNASADALKLTVVADDACAARAPLFRGTWHRRH
jgi:hypothetical protein